VLQFAAVQDLDPPSARPDQAAVFERSQRHVYGRTLDTEHLREKFLGQGNLVAIGPVRV
jgi:hypothetical protein